MNYIFSAGKTQDLFANALRLLLALVIMSPTSVFANPSGGQVIAGLAAIGSGGSVVTINQLTDRAVINWNGFSINAGELTRFMQPSALSAVLNRVTGGDPSAIYGALQANGQVYLINPNGIAVGPSGVINTQSFIASTLDVVVGQFMAGGDLLFAGGSMADVKNAGKISALGGDVLLIAHNLANTGEISAANGTAAMAAGSEVLLKSAGNERVFVQAGGGAADVGVDQKGRILAAAAELKAAGGNVYGLAINNEGVVRANGVENRGGRIFLTATGGSVVNSGELSAVRADKGGEVRIAADNITLKSGSLIDVSGKNGGGTALVGGDHNGNSGMVTANNTVVEEGALIKAGATVSGDGGFVEVSGDELVYKGFADLRTPLGEAGTLLLDPVADPHSVNYDLQTMLNGGNVSIPAVNDFYIDGTNGVVGSITLNSSNNLTLSAGHIVYVNYSVTNLGSGSLTLNAVPTSTARLNADITTYGGAQTYNGNIILGHNEILDGKGGAINFNGTVGGPFTLTVNSDVGGYVNFNGSVGGGTVLAALTVNSTAGKINLDGYNVSTSGDQNYNGDVVLGTDNLLLAGGAITFNGRVDSSDNSGASMNNGLSASANGNIYINGAVGYENALGNLSVQAGYYSNDVFIPGRIHIRGGEVTTDGDQTYNGDVRIGQMNASLKAYSNRGIEAAGDITFNGLVDSYYHHDLTIHADNSVTFQGAVGNNYELGSLDVTAVNGDINLNGADNSGFADPQGYLRNTDDSMSGQLVHTAGGQNYTGKVVLGNNAELISEEGGITFNGAVHGSMIDEGGGHSSLYTYSNGDTAFNGAVGVGDGNILARLVVTANGEIYLNGLDNTSFISDPDLSGEVIETNGRQEYYGNVWLGNNTELNSSYITFNGSVAQEREAPASGLVVNSRYDVNFNGPVGGMDNDGGVDDYPLNYLKVNIGNTEEGSIRVNGGLILTVGDQAYSGPVVINGMDAKLTSSDGDITFNGMLDSFYDLAVSAGNSVTFKGAVGDNHEPGNLDVKAGNINLNGGYIETTGRQYYNGDVVLGADSELYARANSGPCGDRGCAPAGRENYGYALFGADPAGRDITFNGRVDSSAGGNFGLDVEGDNIYFKGAVGSGSHLGSLYAKAGDAGYIHVQGGEVTTDGDQTYNGDVGIEQMNAGLNAYHGGQNGAAGDITFNGKVDSPYALDLNIHAADSVYFKGEVGDNHPLGSLDVTADGGLIHIQGGEVGTYGDQDYNGGVRIGQMNTAFYIYSGECPVGDVTFNGLLDSYYHYDLTIQATGDVYFKGAVGSAYPLGNLDVTADSGRIHIQGGEVTTDGYQYYNGDVRIGQMDTVLNAYANIPAPSPQISADPPIGGDIVFNGLLDSYYHYDLDINAGNSVYFKDAVGSAYPLGNLYVGTDNGRIHIQGGEVTTDGDQTYNGDVRIGQMNASLKAYSNRGIEAAGDITFNGLVDSYYHHDLTIHADNSVTFQGAVGNNYELGSLDVTAVNGDINLNGADNSGFADPQGYLRNTDDSMSGQLVHTAGGQNYTGKVVLGNNAELISEEGGITFNGAVHGSMIDEGGGHSSLYTYSNGDTAFNGAVGVGDGNILARLVVTANGEIYLNGLDNTSFISDPDLSGEVIETNGRQEYYGNVWLGNNTELNSSYITFNGSVAQEREAPASGLVVNSRYDVNFNGPVGGMDNDGGVDDYPLNYLKVNIGNTEEGSIRVNGGLILTVGDQAYSGPVVINGMDAKLTSSDGDITFNGMLDSFYDLAVSAGNSVTFKGAVGDNHEPGNLDVKAGNINLNGGYIETTGRQYYNGDVVLGADSELYARANSGPCGDRGCAPAGRENYGYALFGADPAGRDITFNGRVDSSAGGNFGLDVEGDNIYFKGAVGSGSHLGSLYAKAGDAGYIHIQGGEVTTNGDQYYDGDVRIGQMNTSLTANYEDSDAIGDITFKGRLDSYYHYDLTVSADNSATFDGQVGGNYELGNLDVQADSGNIYLKGGYVATYGYQHYFNNVVLGTDNTLKACVPDIPVPAPRPAENNGETRFGDSPANVDITFDGSVDSANGEGGNYGLKITAADDVYFKGEAGNSDIPLSYLNINAGRIHLNGGNVTTDDYQEYNGPVELGADAGLRAGGDITFEGTLDSSGNSGESMDNALTAVASGSVYFKGAVGAGSHLGSLYAEAGDAGRIHIQGGEVTTDGDQYYDGDVRIGQMTANLNAFADSENEAAGDITFDGAVDSYYHHDLNLHADGSVTFSGAVGDNYELGDLYVETANGAINLNGGYVATYGGQDYNGDVVLGTDNTLEAHLPDIPVPAPRPGENNGGPRSGDNTANIDIIFNGRVDSVDDDGAYYGLDISAADDVYFNGEVGNSDTPLSYLNVDANRIHLNGGYNGSGYVSTAGGQNYTGNVTLGYGDTELYAGGNVVFNAQVDSSYSGYHNYGLDINADGDVYFNDAVGNNDPLAYLNVDANRIHLNGGYNGSGYVSTMGGQEYTGTVTLGYGDTELNAGGNVVFNDQVDSSYSGYHNYGLDINADGDVYFKDAAGGLYALGSLNVAAGGKINLDGGALTTTGAQNYDGLVTLGADTLLTTGNSDITFKGTLNGDYGLTLETGSGNITLAAVGDYDPLASDMDFGGGTGLITLTGNVTSRGDQDYTRDVVIGGGVTLDSLAAGSDHDIIFNGAINGKAGAVSALTLNSGSGSVDLEGAVGNTTALTSLATAGTGVTHLTGGAVTTTGEQTYGESVIFYGGTSFVTNGGAVVFAGTVSAGPASPLVLSSGLYLDAKSGDVTFGDNVDVADLTVRGGRVAWNAGLDGAEMKISGTNLVMNGDLYSSGQNGVMMVAGDSFKNAGGHSINLTGGGKYLIYSVSPARNILGGLTGGEQFGTTYTGGPAPVFSGSGFLYSAPLQPPQQSYHGASGVLKFDVPMPVTETYGGRFFSIVDTPTHTHKYKREHQNKDPKTSASNTKDGTDPGRALLAGVFVQDNNATLRGQE